MKILIADDSQIMRKIIRTNLLKLGVNQVLECGDGATAYRTIVANPDIKILFTDLNMPVLNGYDLIKQIRSLPKFKNIEIIVISDHLGESAQQSLLAFGVTSYVPKPFNLINFNETTIPIIEALKNPVDASGNKKVGVAELLELLKKEKPAVKLDSDGLVIIFSDSSIKVTLDALISIAEIKTTKEKQ